MKLSKKFAGALLLGLTVVMMAAVPASAKQLQVRGVDAGYEGYDLEGGFYSYIYKDADEDCDPWLVMPGSDLITMGRLKYDAQITNIRVKGRNAKKVQILPRKAGTYYLKMKVNKYILPGDRVKVSYVVYQRDNAKKKAYNVDLEIRFKKIKIGQIFDSILINGEEQLGEFKKGILSADATTSDKGGIFVDMAPGYKKTSMYAVRKDGTSVRVYNNSVYNWDKVDHLVIYVQPKEKPEFYKRNDCVAGDCANPDFKFAVTLNF